jgi:hypothetical protein
LLPSQGVGGSQKLANLLFSVIEVGIASGLRRKNADRHRLNRGAAVSTEGRRPRVQPR